MPKISNLESSKRIQRENSENFQFGKFLKFPIWKILKISNLESSKNFQFGKFQNFQFGKSSNLRNYLIKKNTKFSKFHNYENYQNSINF